MAFIRRGEDEDKKVQNPTTVIHSLALSTAATAVAHPLTYIKVLIQIGHEPIHPSRSRTIFGKEVMLLPNLFQYAGHIKEVDGWLGLYRGLLPRLFHSLLQSTITNYLTETLKDFNTAERSMSESDNGSSIDEYSSPSDQSQTTVKEFAYQTCEATICRTVGVVISYPFQVISIRMMAQFVGRETYYKGIYSSSKEIYKEEGILGFFSGLIPHLLSEIVALWIFRSLKHTADNYIMPDELSQLSEIKTYTGTVSHYIATTVMYPFQVVANLMAINDTRLAAGNPPVMAIYASWVECYADLNKQGILRRGSSLFRRVVK